MKVHILQLSRRGLVASFATVVALIAGQALGQANVGRGDYPFGADVRGFSLDGDMESGTIPAARPGPPALQLGGAMGPIRWDELRQHQTDPSIRDTDPLTMNGLWEQQFGNAVTHPGGIPITER